MHFSSLTTVLTLLLASTAALTTADDKPEVPGKNPLVYCAAPDDYILEIKSVDLSPNPPEAGKTLNITAVGQLKKKIEKGAKVHVEVKYGLIRILSTNIDLCDQAGNVDLECPVDEGELSLTKSVNIPKEVPPGKYSVLADATTKDDEKITCLESTVEFHRESSYRDWLRMMF